MEYVKKSEKEMYQCVQEVARILEAQGYNPVSQMVGFLISGDPIYITAKQDARNKIQRIDPCELLEEMVKKYFGNEMVEQQAG